MQTFVDNKSDATTGILFVVCAVYYEVFCICRIMCDSDFVIGVLVCVFENWFGVSFTYETYIYVQ